MKRHLVLVGLLAIGVQSTPADALDVDRKIVTVRTVEFPSIPVEGLDFGAIDAEVGYGAVELGRPALKTTRSICVPEHSDSPLNDATEIETYYYEIPYVTTGGFIVVRDGQGRTLFATRIPALESYERFGYDHCPYHRLSNLEREYSLRYGSLEVKARTSARDYFRRNAAEVLDEALFFNVVEEKIPVYVFKNKVRDYSDLDEAARIAIAAYADTLATPRGLTDESRVELDRAVEIWKRALTTSDLADKEARVNRKVAVRLHENIGIAAMLVGDAADAVEHLERAARLSSMVTSRSNGTGTTDLLDRARSRKLRTPSNADLRRTDADVAQLIHRTDGYRNRIPLRFVDPSELAALEATYSEYFNENVIDVAVESRAERDAAIASGRENPYERMVGRSAMQGFFLFLMPYSNKFDTFPVEVCNLSHLNRLRIPNHSFDSVPQQIGEMTALEVLDLSGNAIVEIPTSIGDLANLKKLDLSDNRINRLPDEIGQLKSLKSLQLKGNPLEPGELDRLGRLLPRCKIKG